jgi:multidrug efflux pump subunit AcrA (membrane-fusion protein)
MSNGRTPEQAEKQLAELAQQNRELAAELESLQGQSRALEKAAQEAKAAQQAAEKRAAAISTKLEAVQKEAAELREANKSLIAQVGRLTKQVEKNPLNPLTVEEASVLFEGLISAFRKTRTLSVKEASLNLKLATAKIGDTPVLLLPDPRAVDPAALHEFKLDLTTVAAPSTIEPAAPPPPPAPRKAPAVKKAGAKKREK